VREVIEDFRKSAGSKNIRVDVIETRRRKAVPAHAQVEETELINAEHP
jgi:hypothetical protein